MSEPNKILKLMAIIHEAAVEADSPRLIAHEYPKTPAMDTLLEALRYSDAIWVLDELVNGVE